MPPPPRLGAVGLLRWTWRQLTSMRVALMLLMLLAIVAVPGSLLPQRPQDPSAVAAYLADNPGLGAWLDRLGLFDVYHRFKKRSRHFWIFSTKFQRIPRCSDTRSGLS